VSWSDTFLGVIAVATLVMALIQVGAIVAILRLAVRRRRHSQKSSATCARCSQSHDRRGRSLPHRSHRHRAGAEIDRLMTDLVQRIDQTAGIVRDPSSRPPAGRHRFKAGLGVIRGFRERPGQGRTADEEDPLFIG
jgi:hypothetical protein